MTTDQAGRSHEPKDLCLQRNTRRLGLLWTGSDWAEADTPSAKVTKSVNLLMSDFFRFWILYPNMVSGSALWRSNSA